MSSLTFGEELSSQFWRLDMRLKKQIAVFFVLSAALVARAETKLIEGRGVAKSADGVAAAFNLRVGQVDPNPPQGRFEIVWTRGDATVTITSAAPRFVGVREREGRFHGPATVSVKKGNDVRRWEGTVYFTAMDLRDASHPDRKDRIRVRFIRNVWESPEGDFFFEGPVTEGNVLVKKT